MSMIFLLCQKSIITEILDFLNGRNISIKFTFEMEHENKIPFLDCLVTEETDGSLVTSVYRKPTCTDHYLNFDSHNPISTKAGIVGRLARRAAKISASHSALSQENKHLVEAFSANSYPTKFVRKNIQKSQSPQPAAERAELKTWARIPC
jgi:hypothetical protein